MKLPNMEILAAAQVPEIAIVSLPTGNVRESRLVCPRGAAPNRVLPVGDWVALAWNATVWSAPLPELGTMKRIAESFRAIPDRERRGIWIHPKKDPSNAWLVGVNGKALEKLPLPKSLTVDHIYGDRILSSVMGMGELFCWSRGDEPRSLGRGGLAAARGRFGLFNRPLDPLDPARTVARSLFDIVEGTEIPVPMPRDRICYTSGGCLAPDGQRVAFTAWNGGGKSVGVVDVSTGTTRIIDNAGEGAAGMLLWSADGEWLITPEFRRGLRVTRAASGESTLVKTLEGQSFQPIVDLASAPELRDAELSPKRGRASATVGARRRRS